MDVGVFRLAVYRNCGERQMTDTGLKSIKLFPSDTALQRARNIYNALGLGAEVDFIDATVCRIANVLEIYQRLDADARKVELDK